jgi:hypothetical protein
MQCFIVVGRYVRYYIHRFTKYEYSTYIVTPALLYLFDVYLFLRIFFNESFKYDFSPLLNLNFAVITSQIHLVGLSHEMDLACDDIHGQF